MKQIKQETGRSMVEMLGVLAVIGVLSVGGIAAYKNAMNRHEANSIRNEVNRRVVVWASDNAFGRGYSSFNKNALGYQWEYPPKDMGDFIQFGVSGIEAEICDKVKSNDWKMVYVNENCTTFAFKNDLTRSEIQPTCGPCGVANPITGACNDDDSKCGSGETCYNGYCSTCGDGEFKTSRGSCEGCLGTTVAFVPASPEECYRCSGSRFYSNGSPASNSRCTLCTDGNSNTTKENCLACSDTVFTSGKSCYYCDPKYADLDRDNRDLGLQACKKKPDIQCDDGWAFIRGTCRDCATENIITIGTDYEEAKRCFGIETKDSQFGCSAAGSSGCYPFWNSYDSRLMPCKDNRALPSTQEGCLVCNQPNSIYRRYFDSANETCVYCPSGEKAPDGTPCDDLTTQSTTAGIASTS